MHGRHRFQFLQIYDALPPDAQHTLVRRHLAPLLDVVPADRRRRATADAAHIQHRYARMPALDLRAKKAEIASLLVELARDQKRAVVNERARREQLLSDAVDCLARWLDDIWKVVFEFRTNYGVAHACLLFAYDALDQIGHGCGGCRCAYAAMFIPVTITRSTGRVVKSFLLNGAHNLENVLLWIWRDLFVTLLATGTKRQRNTVPDMLDDIRVLLGWRALERLLRGGHKALSEDSDHDNDSDHTAESLGIVDDDGDQNYISDDWSSVCDDLYPRSFYASHWSWRIADQQPQLRDLVHTALLDIFKVAPSGPLYASMMAIAEDEDGLEEELHPLVMDVAGHSSDNLAAALRILSLNNRADSLDDLLATHKHLLRTQDAASLQFATLIMSSDVAYRAHAMAIVEEELVDVTNVFRAAVRFCFGHIEAPSHTAELAQILALRRDSLNRRTRVERWVKAVLTPQGDNTHPMALAALMMGIPLPPGVEATDEGDMLGYFELDGDDSDVEDLREEFRPNIKARFQGWVDTASAIKGGPTLLLKVYARAVTDMPFLKAGDVVEEMASRISDRPSKMHVSDALDAFKEFCDKQASNVAAVKRKAHRTAAASTSRPPPAPSVLPTPSAPIEDVD